MSFDEDWEIYHDLIVRKQQSRVQNQDAQSRPMRSPSQLSSQRKDVASQKASSNPAGKTYKEKNGKGNTAQRKTTTKPSPKKKLNKRKKIKLTKAGKEFFKKLGIGVGAVGLSAIMLYTALNGVGGRGGDGAEKPIDNDPPVASDTIHSGNIVDPGNVGTTIIDDEVVIPETQEPVVDEWTMQEALQYKDYCYYGKYAGQTWLFCPQEKVLENAELAIKLMEEDFANKGSLKTGQIDDKYIADWITPEFIAAIAMNESTFRVEDENGRALGELRDRPEEKNAEGMTQCLKYVARDIYEFYSRHSDNTEFENLLNIDGEKDPRHNPFLAECYTVGLFQWMEEHYLYEGSSLCQKLGIDRNNMSDSEYKSVMQNIAAGCYYTGVGGVSNNVNKGRLSLKDFVNPDKNSSYDAIMYAGRMSYHKDKIMKDIENSQEMEQ